MQADEKLRGPILRLNNIGDRWSVDRCNQAEVRSVMNREIRHLLDVCDTSLIDPPQNLLGTVWFPALRMDELLHAIFCEREEIEFFL